MRIPVLDTLKAAVTRARFKAVLRRTGQDFVVEHGTMTVRGDLFLRGVKICPLPDDLTVQGDLTLASTSITRLPRRLRVHANLDLGRTRITMVPNCLRVGRSLSMERSGVATLPDNLHVPGCLMLSGSKVTQLPSGLHVGENLNLHSTGITRLPQDLRVGGMIFPPDDLQDIQDFARDHVRDREILVSPHGSGHWRLHLMDRLRPFPDMLTIVRLLDDRTYLAVWRKTQEPARVCCCLTCVDTGGDHDF